MENQALIQMATQVRRDIVRMVHGAASGHPGGSLGCADLLTLLYFEEMQLNPDQFDRFNPGPNGLGFFNSRYESGARRRMCHQRLIAQHQEKRAKAAQACIQEQSF